MEHKMKQLNISKDIVPISEFKSSLSKWLKNIQNTGHPLVITQNGRPAGVLLSPSEYDELVYKRHFLDSVNRGISDAESGNVYSTKELKKELDKRRQRGSK
jgi:prevent-host-death family protein